MTEPQPTKDWLDQLVEDVTREHPEGELLVSSGHSPSGTYHIGTLREIVTANAITWALRQAGRKARHIDFVDDFDAFRKVPTGIGVPESWSQYLGQPLRVVPDPWECHPSYGEHFFASLTEGLEAIGAVPDETVHGYDNYRLGAMASPIETALGKLSEARDILTEVGGRQLDEHWSPVQIVDEHNNLRNRKFVAWDKDKKLVSWRDNFGQTGEVGIDAGDVKLDWRLDWPARWAKWGITVEPFGRDHATKGGSYQTGAVIVDKVFGGHPPYPVPYEFINSVGDTKKMSKSAGNVLTPQQALEVMPPEILRFFVVKARPGRTLMFDAGLGLYQLIDEYAAAEAGEPTAAMKYARAAASEPMIAQVPFSHLVAVYQTGRGDSAAIKTMLDRTGYETAVKNEWPTIERELVLVKNWLATHAPDSVKFAVQDKLPELDLTEKQQVFLSALADAVEAGSLDGQGMHEAIYAAKETAGLAPAEAFKTLYQVILGQDSGPKAGWFLASLDSAWLAKRLRLVA